MIFSPPKDHLKQVTIGLTHDKALSDIILRGAPSLGPRGQLANPTRYRHLLECSSIVRSEGVEVNADIGWLHILP
eukprot:scaffold5980_cov145-Isochrysis_galbana.AAC.4